MFSILASRTVLLTVGCLTLAPAAGCGEDRGTGSDTDGTTTPPTTGTSAPTTTTGGTSTTTSGTASGTASGTTSSAGSTAMTEGSGGDWPVECACLEAGCGAPPCAVIAAGCEGECPMGFTVDEDALTCALEALRDGTPGTIEWSYALNAQGASESGRISILADRAAIRGVSFDMVVCSGTESIIHGPLPEPAVYEACLADPTLAARFDCVRQVLAAINILCAPGSDDCD